MGEDFSGNPTPHPGIRRSAINGTVPLNRFWPKIVGRTMPHSVLLVDDSSSIRKALYRLFTVETDFKVCGEAENGREAIDKAQQMHPDLIVMDLSMPVMNGIDAAHVLKGLMPRVPVIIFSEYCDVFARNEAQSCGIAALVPKSERGSRLLETVRALLAPVAA